MSSGFICNFIWDKKSYNSSSVQQKSVASSFSYTVEGLIGGSY